jgi:6-phosphogluconolactonase (cycloisomerase 2 family)
MSFNRRGNLLAVMVLNDAAPDNSFAVAILSVKQRTRTLAPAARHRLGKGSPAEHLAFSPNGRLLAVSGDYDDDVTILRVNQSTGALRRVPGSPFRTGATPESLAFSRDGGLLAVVNADDQDFSVFSVRKRTGSLRPVPGSPFGRAPSVLLANWVAFSPRANLLAYGAGDEPGKVAIFSTVF